MSSYMKVKQKTTSDDQKTDLNPTTSVGQEAELVAPGGPARPRPSGTLFAPKPDGGPPTPVTPDGPRGPAPLPLPGSQGPGGPMPPGAPGGPVEPAHMVHSTGCIYVLHVITIAMTCFSYFININKFQLYKIYFDMDGRVKCPPGIKISVYFCSVDVLSNLKLHWQSL